MFLDEHNAQQKTKKQNVLQKLWGESSCCFYLQHIIRFCFLLVIVVLHKLLQLLNIPDWVEILLYMRQHWYIWKREDNDKHYKRYTCSCDPMLLKLPTYLGYKVCLEWGQFTNNVKLHPLLQEIVLQRAQAQVSYKAAARLLLGNSSWRGKKILCKYAVALFNPGIHNFYSV